MLRDKMAAVALVALIAAGYCHDARADGLPKNGLLPIGEVSKIAPSSWSGFYIGGHVGYGWSAFDGNMIYTDAPKYPNLKFDDSSKTIDTDGAIAGGLIGFNIQTGNIVWGIEADASWADISGSRTLLPFPGNAGSPAWDFESQIEWLASVRGRLGFTSGRTLVYGTAGVAFAGIETSIDVVGPGYSAYGSKNEIVTGWTVGGGVEWQLGQSWTMRAEYLYYKFDDAGGILKGMQSTNCAPACPHTTDGFAGDLDLHTVRLGLNYRFGSK